MSQLQNLSAPIGRLLLVAIFIYSGIGKITNYEATQAYMQMMGVPSIMLPLVILLEVLGGMAILVGFKARWVALLFAAFSILSALIFHPFGDPEQQNDFMKNIAISGGFLMIFAHGAGAFSFDESKKSHSPQVS